MENNQLSSPMSLRHDKAKDKELDGINPEFQELTPNTFLGHIDELTNDNRKEVLASLRVKPSDKIAPPQKAWMQPRTNAILGTMGNFSLIIGKAKSRKSFFINIAISTVVSNDEVLDQYKGALPSDQRKVLYFDTEQGKYHVQLALKRVCEQININEPKALDVYGLRSLKPAERLNIIEYAIYNTPNLGFVVIDGIKDLISSINDEGEATLVASKLLKWTEEKNIHIVTVLHQNKSDNNARGHVGTELINKAETVLAVTKSEQDKDISIVEAQQCRNKEPEPFAFEIDENGLPVIVENYEVRTSTKKASRNQLIDCTLEYQIKLLRKTYSKGESYTYSNLIIQIKLAFAELYSNEQIGTNKIKEFITHCKNEQLIIQLKEKGPYTLGKLQGLS